MARKSGKDGFRITKATVVCTFIFEQMTHYEGISMTKFNNLKVKRVRSNLKYTDSKLVKQRPR